MSEQDDILAREREEIERKTLEDIDKQADADGFCPWVTFTGAGGADSHKRKLAACCALLAVSRIDFKLLSFSGGEGAQICVKKPDRKAMEVILGLSSLVDVQSPQLLRIIIPEDIQLRTVIKDEDGRVTSLEPGDPQGGRFSDI